MRIAPFVCLVAAASVYAPVALCANVDLRTSISIRAKAPDAQSRYTVKPREIIDVIVTVKNSGTGTANNVALSALPPRGLTYLKHRLSSTEASYNTGTNYTRGGSVDISEYVRGTFNFGGGLLRLDDIRSGEQKSLVITTQVANAAAGTTLSFATGYAHASTPDANPADNRRAIKIAVQARSSAKSAYDRFLHGTRITRELHVSPRHAQARDSNPGTAAAPLATLGAAVQNALSARKTSKASTRILLYDGVYRESVEQYFKDDAAKNGAKIIIQAVENGQAVLSGSKRLAPPGWKKYGATPGLYSHTWSGAVGRVAQPWPNHNKGYLEPLGLRREMVFADGISLIQTTSHSDLKSTASSFFLDDASRTLYVNLPQGMQINNTEMEVATRDTLLKLDRLNNLALVGLVFQHSNAGYSKGAVAMIHQSNVLIQNCIFQWNNARGLWPWHIHELTVDHSIFNNNGEDGISGGELFDTRWENSETSYNNWRGFQGGLIGWAPGNKTYVSRNLQIINHVSVGNLARGLWFDKDNRDLLVDNAIVCDNLFDGIFSEANPGPITIRNSLICSNGGEVGEKMQNIPPAGLRVSSTNHFTLRNNVFRDNHLAQVNLSGHNKHRRVGLRKFNVNTHEKTTRDVVINNRYFTLSGNTLSAQSKTQRLHAYVKDEEMWNILFESSADSFVSSGNSYCHPLGSSGEVFEYRHNKLMDFAEWRSATGDNSKFLNSSAAACEDPSGGPSDDGSTVPAPDAPRAPEPNAPPSADASATNSAFTDSDGDGKHLVTLDGSRSADGDGTISRYVWERGDTTLANGKTVRVELPVGVFTIRLTVVDNDGASASAAHSINVRAAADGPRVAPPSDTNAPPVANASLVQTLFYDVDGDGRHRVVLDAGRSRDSDGTIKSYAWHLGNQRIATTAVASANLNVGKHTLALRVTDNDGATDEVMRVVTVRPRGDSAGGNRTPSADASLTPAIVRDADGNGQEIVTLNASRSSDPDGSVVAYLWKIGANILARSRYAKVSLNVGVHEIRLLVTDDGGKTVGVTHRVSVRR